tara:strand:+ start:12790 stop:13209 length:420 start_codon:yes stop_codon:yes gene_type:complete
MSEEFDIKQYIKHYLGEPVVQLMISDPQIDEVIKDADMRFGVSNRRLSGYRDYCMEKCCEITDRINKRVNSYFDGSNGSDNHPDHFVLSDKHPNVIHINCGRMPFTKAEEYMERVREEFKKRIHNFGDYDCIFLKKSGD